MGNNRGTPSIWPALLWLDVERIQDTTQGKALKHEISLWFDVERIWETTCTEIHRDYFGLWFDVEWIWETTLLL